MPLQANSLTKIELLFSLCKADVIITYNAHKSNYESVEEYFVYAYQGEMRVEIDDQVFAEMVARDKIVNIHFYPNSPTGFHVVWHYDLEAAVDAALTILLNTDQA